MNEDSISEHSQSKIDSWAEPSPMGEDVGEGVGFGIIFKKFIGPKYGSGKLNIILLPRLVPSYYDSTNDMEFSVAAESLVEGSFIERPTLGAKSFKMTIGVKGGKVIGEIPAIYKDL